MARIIFGSYMVRYPLGGMLSWALQYMLGLKDLGHEVYFVEKAGYERSCFDVSKGEMTNDCSYGMRIVSELFKRFDLEGRICFVDYDGKYHGMQEREIRNVFKDADLFIDSGTHGSWSEESSLAKQRILIDGEPGYTQFKWANNLEKGIEIPRYDRYFTNGKNIGTVNNPVPTLGLTWEPIYSPVSTRIFEPRGSSPGAPYSTVMNWQSHPPIIYKDRKYGQKDIEFEKFISLPLVTSQSLEIAVSGKQVPFELLRKNGWTIADAQQKTVSFDSFCDYIRFCRGEFSVCKNVFIENNTGWFSDKGAAYLACGRPVILQETGFSRHLPVGRGLFAVSTVEEAKEAIGQIESDYELHAKAAREIACEYLDARKVMAGLLDTIGI